MNPLGKTLHRTDIRHLVRKLGGHQGALEFLHDALVPVVKLPIEKQYLFSDKYPVDCTVFTNGAKELCLSMTSESMELLGRKFEVVARNGETGEEICVGVALMEKDGNAVSATLSLDEVEFPYFKIKFALCD